MLAPQAPHVITTQPRPKAGLLLFGRPPWDARRLERYPADPELPVRFARQSQARARKHLYSLSARRYIAGMKTTAAGGPRTGRPAGARGQTKARGPGLRIRPIQPPDNPAVAAIIRAVMTEYGAVGCGFSIQDAEVDAMFEAYPPPRSAFFVVEAEGRILGCGGMGPLRGGAAGVCELRKMYFLPELRGSGLGTRLLLMILDAARVAGYTLCYLETLETMHEARKLYLRQGFKAVPQALGNTGHSSCNRFMTRDL
jgi:putative acetyltransferase